MTIMFCLSGVEITWKEMLLIGRCLWLGGLGMERAVNLRGTCSEVVLREVILWIGDPLAKR